MRPPILTRSFARGTNSRSAGTNIVAVSITTNRRMHRAQPQTSRLRAFPGIMTPDIRQRQTPSSPKCAESKIGGCGLQKFFARKLLVKHCSRLRVDYTKEPLYPCSVKLSRLTVSRNCGRDKSRAEGSCQRLFLTWFNNEYQNDAGETLKSRLGQSAKIANL